MIDRVQERVKGSADALRDSVSAIAIACLDVQWASTPTGGLATQTGSAGRRLRKRRGPGNSARLLSTGCDVPAKRSAAPSLRKVRVMWSPTVEG